MLEHVRKFGTIVVIAILFAFFSFSLVDLVVESPDYEDYCGKIRPMMPYEKECEPLEIDYSNCEGAVTYTYGTDGCPVSYVCDTCQSVYNAVQKQHRFYGFLVTSILGVMAIIAGLYIRGRDAMEWILSGLLIGGILSVFIGTAMYFGDMNRFVRPAVLLGEIGLITWIVVKTFKK